MIMDPHSWNGDIWLANFSLFPLNAMMVVMANVSILASLEQMICILKLRSVSKLSSCFLSSGLWGQHCNMVCCSFAVLEWHNLHQNVSGSLFISNSFLLLFVVSSFCYSYFFLTFLSLNLCNL